MLGGIALFLFGMNMMSDGLERVAGSSMRTILEKLTKNRFIATIVGIAITAVIQSSSAVTSMVVSFVNAGLMTLTQSVGVIFGANIGTSVTGQLMAFDFDAYAPLIAAVSVAFYLFSKKEFVKKLSYVFLGFGVLFMGMGIMKDSMSVISESEAVTDALSGTTNPFLLLLLGIALTALVQSSSAISGILITLASSGLISVEMSFYVLIGSSIGATVTAVITSLNGNRNSKRAALVDVLFNVFGAAVIFILLMFFEEQIADFIYMISPGSTDAAVASRAVAMANTVFRIFNVIIMFPLAGILVKLTKVFIPVKDHSQDVEDYTELKYIGENKPQMPSTVLVETSKEIERTGSLAAENIDTSMDLLNNSYNEQEYKKVMEYEEYVDLLTFQLQEYMANISQTHVPISEQEKVAGFFHAIIDIERLSDHAENLADFAKAIAEDKVNFSDDAKEELRSLCMLVSGNVKESLVIFTTRDFTRLDNFTANEIRIDRLSKKYQSNHIKRMAEGVCSPKSGIFSDILVNLERMGDHANNIAYSLAPQGTEEETEARVSAQIEL